MATKLLVDLCSGFKMRSEVLEYKGKKRDNALMDYMSGAYSTLKADPTRDEDAKHIGICMALLFSTRGYSEVEKIVKEGVTV